MSKNAHGRLAQHGRQHLGGDRVQERTHERRAGAGVGPVLLEEGEERHHRLRLAHLPERLVELVGDVHVGGAPVDFYEDLHLLWILDVVDIGPGADVPQLADNTLRGATPTRRSSDPDVPMARPPHASCRITEHRPPHPRRSVARSLNAASLDRGSPVTDRAGESADTRLPVR
jgi:hypothetical protein